MDYQRHYAALIARARHRPEPQTVERHHVIPRCMGGDNSPFNLVNLTPAEHYVAHQLLAKMHPDVRGLVHAAVKMSRQCTGNKAYSWLRKRHSEIVRSHRHAPEVRARISKSLRGQPKPPRSAAHIANLSKPRNLTAEARERMGASMRNQRHTAKTKAIVSAALTGRRKTAETRKRMSSASIGNKRALGHKHSPESIELMRKAKRERDAAKRIFP